MSTKDTSFSGSHGKAKKPIGKDGLPKLKESPIPGRDWKTGTPKYISSAASAAERKRDFNTDTHRQHPSRAGAPQHPADPRLARVGEDEDEA